VYNFNSNCPLIKTMLTTAVTRIAIYCLASLAVIGAARADKITIWVDDAHTRQIEVEELDPDQIADPSSFSLGFGQSVSNVGISFGYSREQGVKYDEQVEKLIETIRELCEEFNEGQVSLESYQARIRRIFSSIESARLCRMELMVSNVLAANKASAKLDRLLGIPAADNAAFEQRIKAQMDSFRELVNSIPPDQMPEPAENEVFDGAQFDEIEVNQQAAAERLREMDVALTARPIRSTDGRTLIKIWKDRALTISIVVPELDVEELVDDFEESLCVQMKFSAPLVCQCIGPDIHWTLESRARYDEAAQQLIVKYRKLCLEYNGGLVSQEDYFDRLVELSEAEQRAFAAREEMADRLNERAAAMAKEMDKQLGSEPTAEMKALRGGMDSKRGKLKKIMSEQDQTSVVDDLSKAHREEMAAWDAFVASVGEVRVNSDPDTVSVFVDDKRDRKIDAPKLDVDMIAKSVKTRLCLHFNFFNFGPECAWAQTKGIEYGNAAQMLIVKSKQLCMDYNAGLVTQESYLRRSRRIDASIEQAGKVREGLVEFYIALKGEARNKLDRRLRINKQ
jgi:hypothetical protein